EHYQWLQGRVPRRGLRLCPLPESDRDLTHDDDPEHHTTSVLYIHVDDADRLAADWRRSGMTVDGPRNEDYGKREGRHVDPDRNLIRFGSPIPLRRWFRRSSSAPQTPITM